MKTSLMPDTNLLDTILPDTESPSGSKTLSIDVSPAKESKNRGMKRVLVVEDNPPNMELIVEILGTNDLIIDMAENGHEAVKKAEITGAFSSHNSLPFNDNEKKKYYYNN